jgi:hypothetical protein
VVTIPPRVSDQLRGLLEVDVDRFVRFRLYVFWSNLEFSAKLCPKFIQVGIFREDTNQVHFLLTSKFSPELNPRKHGEIVAP